MSMPNLTRAAVDLCDVTDRLPLLFVLLERAVAAVHAESPTPHLNPRRIAVDEERRQTRGERAIEVQARDSGVFGRRGAHSRTAAR